MLSRVMKDIDEVFSSFNTIFDEMETFRKPISNIKYDEEKAEWVARIELPGIDKDDLEVTLSENTISIKAEKEDRKFRSTFKIGSNIDQDSISAELKDGLLTLTFKEIVPEQKRIELK